MPLGPHHLQKAVMQFPAHWRATPTWMCPEILFIKNRIGDTQRQKESDLEKEPKDSFCWSTEVELPWGVTPYPPQDFHRSPGPGPKNTCRLRGPIKNPCEYGVGAGWNLRCLSSIWGSTITLTLLLQWLSQRTWVVSCLCNWHTRSGPTFLKGNHPQPSAFWTNLSPNCGVVDYLSDFWQGHWWPPSLAEAASLWVFEYLATTYGVP